MELIRAVPHRYCLFTVRLNNPRKNLPSFVSLSLVTRGSPDGLENVVQKCEPTPDPSEEWNNEGRASNDTQPHSLYRSLTFY